MRRIIGTIGALAVAAVLTVPNWIPLADPAGGPNWSPLEPDARYSVGVGRPQVGLGNQGGGKDDVSGFDVHSF
jgi:hypothetical protein